MPSNTKRPYEIGYGKPPKQTRFEKGRSGNPKGRPKGLRSIGAYLKRELDQLVTISQDGERYSVTKRKAILLQLIKRAIRGNPRSMDLLMREIRALEPEKKGPEIIIKYYKDPPKSGS